MNCLLWQETTTNFADLNIPYNKNVCKIVIVQMASCNILISIYDIRYVLTLVKFCNIKRSVANLDIYFCKIKYLGYIQKGVII